MVLEYLKEYSLYFEPTNPRAAGVIVFKPYAAIHELLVSCVFCGEKDTLIVSRAVQDDQHPDFVHGQVIDFGKCLKKKCKNKLKQASQFVRIAGSRVKTCVGEEGALLEHPEALRFTLRNLQLEGYRSDGVWNAGEQAFFPDKEFRMLVRGSMVKLTLKPMVINA